MTQLAARPAWIGTFARAIARVAVLLALAGGATVAVAQEKVQITDAYIELRTGPGRGYPVFFVAGRDEWIEILMRHTDWFKVRAANGSEGWVNRSQLETTLTEAGAAKTFRDVLVGDYLRRKLELGAAWGQFKGEPMLKVWTGYRFADALSLEAAIGQVQGTFSGTEFWNVNINVEPWSDRRLSPFLGLGVGQFKNVPNASLVGGFVTNATLANASVGVRYYMAERFVARLDYTIYTAYVSDRDTGEYKAVTAGIAFFF
ncbi:MAG: SH3 domain-containing protein [Burkholderiaceae bacterium]